MTSKSKPRYDLSSANYHRGGYLKINDPSDPEKRKYLEVEIDKNEIQSIFNNDISNENLGQFLEDIHFQIGLHLIKSKALDNRTVPTSAEYIATFKDLVDSISKIEHKLSALNGFPFDHKIDEHLLSRVPEKLPCDFIDETINNLDKIKLSATDALNVMESKTGRRKKPYDNISFFISIATIFEKYTGNFPSKYCIESKDKYGYGKYAKLVQLCCQKAHIPMTSNFCNQIKTAIDEYEEGR